MIRLNDRGYSLAEVMVGMGLLILVALAGSQLGIFSIGTSQNAQVSTELTTLADEIRTLFATEQACRHAFGGPMAYQGAARSETPVIDPAGSTPVILYRDGQNANPEPLIGDPAALAAANQNSRYAQWPPEHASFAGQKAAWEIDRMELVPDAGMSQTGSVVPMILEIEARRLYGSNSGTIKKISNLGVTVQLDGGGNLTSCTSLTYGTDILPVPLCRSDEALSTDGTRTYCSRIRCCPDAACATVNPICGYAQVGGVMCPYWNNGTSTWTCPQQFSVVPNPIPPASVNVTITCSVNTIYDSWFNMYMADASVYSFNFGNSGTAIPSPTVNPPAENNTFASPPAYVVLEYTMDGVQKNSWMIITANTANSFTVISETGADPDGMDWDDLVCTVTW